MSRDTAVAAQSSLFYALAMAISAVAGPLLGLSAGFGAAEIGFYIALSGLAQLLARLWLIPALRRWTDRSLLIVSVLVLVVANLILVFPVTVALFVASQVLQGISRAWFWAALQSHVVRAEHNQIGALGRLNLVSSVGTITGPLVAGFLAGWGLEWAFLASACSATLAVLVMLRLKPLAILPVKEPGARIVLGPGVVLGACASASSGAWHALLGAFVPVVLAHAGHSPTSIGMFVSLANIAILVGSGLLTRWLGNVRGRGLILAMVLAGVGMGAMGAIGGSVVLTVAALAVSGTAAGILHTLGPALASRSVGPDERAGAIVATGTARAVALLTAPLATSGLLLLPGMSLVAAMGVMGVAIMAPIPIVHRSSRAAVPAPPPPP